MIVHRSNRTEALVEALAELVATPLGDPFAAETVVVQNLGMARWLGLELARRLGVWANPAFPFPRAFVRQVAAAVLGEPPAGAAAYQPESLAWAIAAELPRLTSARFAPVRRFLDDDRDGNKLLPLATRLADLFDQYAVFRPDLVRQWEQGGGGTQDWQPALWRALVERLGPHHPAARAEALLRALPDARRPGAPFPERVSVFGLATLPPTYVDLLAGLAPLVELHLFILGPTAEYVGDLPSRRERRQALASGADEGDLYLDAPPLLASLGRVGRDFQAVLEERADYQADDRYADPGEATLLAALQSDLLHARQRGDAADTPRLRLDPADDSLAVHSCHAPMREIEVLHDRLVALFAADPSLRPHDVIVMAPSIDRYAPLIEAVFTSPDRPRLPYYIADRRARATREVVDVFLRTLELLAGRLPAAAVLDLLALDPVRTRFAIPAESLDQLRRWVDDAGITWGADGAHRAAEGLPRLETHTWRRGLDRLLLGTALPSADDQLWQGVLPCADLEGADATLLGQFVAFVEVLLEHRQLVAAARTAPGWQTLLGGLLAALAARSPLNADQHEAILFALASLAERAEVGGFTGALGLDVVRRLLDAELAAGAAPPGFLTGAVTLCELVPMRTIPFRVVALVGLSDGVFPRVQRPLAFDHIARQPRPGDRTPRDDDRYLFLEALLSARERLLITYVGRSITDNAELPPSVVLAELLEAVDAMAALPPSADGHAPPARTAIVHQHPLQPFSPLAFGPSGPLASFARASFAGARAARGEGREPAPFLTAPLGDAPPITAVELDTLLEFFANPARWFLRERLRLRLPEDRDVSDDRDPIDLAGLEAWKVGDHLLRRARRGEPPDSAWPVLEASGKLPLGAPGRLVIDQQLPDALAIAARAAALSGGAPLAPTEIAKPFDGVELTGLLLDRCATGLLVTQFSKIGRYHELRVWIRHLVLNAAVDEHGESVLIGRARKPPGVTTVRFSPVRDAEQHLRALLALFARGQSRPLPLFQQASRDYAQVLRDGKGDAKAGAAARKAFGDGDREFGFSDSHDESVAMLFPDLPAELEGGEPAAGAIDAREVALTVYEPLFTYRSES